MTWAKLFDDHYAAIEDEPMDQIHAAATAALEEQERELLATEEGTMLLARMKLEEDLVGRDDPEAQSLRRCLAA